MKALNLDKAPDEKSKYEKILDAIPETDFWDLLENLQQGYLTQSNIVILDRYRVLRRKISFRFKNKNTFTHQANFNRVFDELDSFIGSHFVLEKQTNFFALYPDHKNSTIKIFGEDKEEKFSWKDLLTILKDIRIRLEEKYYKFVASMAEVDINEPIHLAECEIRFSDSQHAIFIDDRKCEMSPDKNEYALCKIMFSNEYPLGIAVDWDILYEKITGNVVEVQPPESQIHTVRQTVIRLNNRIKNETGTEEKLFTWAKLTVTRNY